MHSVCVCPNGDSFGLPLAPREFDLRRLRKGKGCFSLSFLGPDNRA